MSQKIKAFIINRNLITTLKNTVEFLKKDERIEVIILDQNSDYPDLISYYEEIENLVTIYRFPNNEGPHAIWHNKVSHLHNGNYFILADSDCIYDTVPNDWLDIMLNTIKNTNFFKVGFSLSIENLPNTELLPRILDTETKYWKDKCEYGWIAHIDTTFALYRPNSGFSYDALRLDKPYCIKHAPWYITKENITEEWKYYINNVSGVSTWGNPLKAIYNDVKV